MKPLSWADRLRYRVDNAIAKGPAVLLWWLVGLMLLVVFLAAVLTTLGHYAPVPPTPGSATSPRWPS
jgi:hypothetical protein